MSKTPELVTPSRVTASEALAVVGLTVQDVQKVAGKELAEGPSYLVGSLSSGLGNSGSDVDIQILRTGISSNVGPYMFFANDVIVDIEGYPAEWPADVRTTASTMAIATTALGDISIDARLTRKAAVCVARWWHAVPLDDATPLIFSDRESAQVLPLLLRDGYEKLLVSVAIARLADAADAPEAARGHLWRQASRQLLDLRCRAAGDVTTNIKWLSTRAQRLSVPHAAEATDSGAFRRAAELCGLPVVDAWELTRLGPAKGSEVVKFAGRQQLLTRHGRLLGEWCNADGSLRDVARDVAPARLFESVRRAELDLVIDSDAVRKALS